MNLFLQFDVSARDESQSRHKLEFEDDDDFLNMDVPMEDEGEQDEWQDSEDPIGYLNLVHSKLSNEAIPKLDMKFMTEEAACQFYNAYAYKLGFSVRRSREHKDKSGRWTKHVKSGIIESTCASTLVEDPKAMMGIRYKELCRLCTQLATRVAEAEEAHKIALNALKKIAEEVDASLIGETLDGTSHANISASQEIMKPPVVKEVRKELKG
ncbi:hypothetical protein Vadar_016063 [Vaccinium darrowii]|uniref:Uncharacterized protein n=1 Tax=Vaccinium darrowii TaxID=229202 RepID=A0ACB7YP60_9ERIC|nr:hypothetical protein Vadar_016063 [Vaccinium darrowii]